MSVNEDSITAAAALVGLTISEAHRPGVRQFLDIAREMHETLMAVSLEDDDLALAPVFVPPDLPR